MAIDMQQANRDHHMALMGFRLDPLVCQPDGDEQWVNDFRNVLEGREPTFRLRALWRYAAFAIFSSIRS
jgi:hypothetical protein